jgi:hypothetical protein
MGKFDEYDARFVIPETHKSIFSSGWVGILAQWKQSPNLLITLPATKALCNLDQVKKLSFSTKKWYILAQNAAVLIPETDHNVDFRENGHFLPKNGRNIPKC